MLFEANTPVSIDGGIFPLLLLTGREMRSSCCILKYDVFVMLKGLTWSMTGQKHALRRFVLVLAGFLRMSHGGGERKRVNCGLISSVPRPLVTVLGTGDIFCVHFLPHSLFQCRQACAPEHTLAFSGCLSWFFSSYFGFTPPFPPPLPLVVTCTFPPPTSLLHSMPHPLSLTFSSSLCCSCDESRVQQEVHLHLYHSCNVLSALIAGLNSMGSTWHRMPVISRPHPKAHFTWSMSGIEQIFFLMQPVQTTPVSSPHRTSRQTSEFYFISLHIWKPDGSVG